MMRGLRPLADSLKSPTGEPLSARGWEILNAVIESYVEDGEPIGSRTVAKLSRERLSPATVRNVMADLEDCGLLWQPHASAGRVPTEAAYRLYVDAVVLSSSPPRPSAQSSRIQQALAGTHGEIPPLLEEASRVLSKLSRNVGVVLAPELSRVVVERLDFVRLEGRRVLAVLVDPAGVVTQKLIGVAEEIPQDRLDRMGRVISEEFNGLTLSEARARLERLMAEQRAHYDSLHAKAMALAGSWLAGSGPSGTVYVGGTSNVLGRPEFPSARERRALLAALEEKERLVDLLSRCMDERGVSVRIGSENDDPRLHRCAVLAAPYGVEGRVLGTVGIIGPTRMRYAKAVSLVESLSGAMSQLLGQASN